MEFVFKWEGGYVNDPDDPGGETNFGISKKTYPKVDIKNLTKERARAIYKKDYWDMCLCDELDSPADIIVFDTAVSMGLKKALTLFQESEGWMDYLFRRMDCYAKIAKSPSKQKFLRGWINRVVDLYRLAEE